MTADTLFEHIKEVAKEREGILREEHEKEVVQIKKGRLNSFEELKKILDGAIKAERTIMIERRMREEESKIKAEISFHKNELLKQTKEEAKKMFFEMDEDKIIDIFAARLRPIKDRLFDEAKLTSSKKYFPLAKEISERAAINCLVEVRDVPDGKLAIESRGMIVDLSVEELIEESAQKNSAKLYQIVFN